MPCRQTQDSAAVNSSRLRSRPAPPKAGAMLEALRGLGYTTAAAIADIIDNSVTASARTVTISFKWDGQFSSISILDDGHGMNADELEQAMHLGDQNPRDDRQPHDLGRFGLGLKTASLSQCRCLTVASKKDQLVSCMRWDLDFLASSPDNEWYLLEVPVEAFCQPLNHLEKGTLVIWEAMDRIVSYGFTEQDFVDLIDRVEQHLAMVFHRYLEGPAPRLSIILNGRSVSPWNPFLPHAARWSSPVETIRTTSGDVVIQCHVLPHKDHLDAREYKDSAGPEGWTGQQGFYVYRNDRLIVGGSWLGLGHGRSWTKEEAHRLARIRLDIANSADSEWKLDIRKSTAKPPVALRPRLTRLAEDTRRRARQVFAHRSIPTAIGTNAPVLQAWRTEHSNSGIRYRIDGEHPAVQAVLEGAGTLRPLVDAMIRVIEETVPVQRIWLDTTEGQEVPRIGFTCDPLSDVQKVLDVMYRNLVVNKGMAPSLARAQLLRTEPFNNYCDLVMALPDVPDERA